MFGLVDYTIGRFLQLTSFFAYDANPVNEILHLLLARWIFRRIFEVLYIVGRPIQPELLKLWWFVILCKLQCTYTMESLIQFYLSSANLLLAIFSILGNWQVISTLGCSFYLLSSWGILCDNLSYLSVIFFIACL